MYYFSIKSFFFLGSFKKGKRQKDISATNILYSHSIEYKGCVDNNGTWNCSISLFFLRIVRNNDTTDKIVVK